MKNKLKTRSEHVLAVQKINSNSIGFFDRWVGDSCWEDVCYKREKPVLANVTI